MEKATAAAAARDRAGSHLLEAILETAPRALRTELDARFLRGDLAAMAAHPAANFVVQALLAAADAPAAARGAAKELAPAAPALLAGNRGGVLVALVAAAARVGAGEGEAAAAARSAAAALPGGAVSGLLTLGCPYPDIVDCHRLSAVGCALLAGLLGLPHVRERMEAGRGVRGRSPSPTPPPRTHHSRSTRPPSPTNSRPCPRPRSPPRWPTRPVPARARPCWPAPAWAPNPARSFCAGSRGSGRPSGRRRGGCTSWSGRTRARRLAGGKPSRPSWRPRRPLWGARRARSPCCASEAEGGDEREDGEGARLAARARRPSPTPPPSPLLPRRCGVAEYKRSSDAWRARDAAGARARAALAGVTGDAVADDEEDEEEEARDADEAADAEEAAEEDAGEPKRKRGGRKRAARAERAGRKRAALR